MLVNGRVAWNMSGELDGVIRQTVNNTSWRVYVVKEILN